MKYFLTLLYPHVHIFSSENTPTKKPNIVIILSDDLGFGDVSWHNGFVKTPHLDNLAAEGITLEQSYTQPSCTPSRHALMTGRYPFRDGLQHLVLLDRTPFCSPLNNTLLPQELKNQGYKTHMIGKWHLGFCHLDCVPNHRGFDSFYGIYHGEGNLYNHTYHDGLDFRYNDQVISNETGNHATLLYRDRALDIIEKHPKDEPLFLYFAMQAPHTPLAVPPGYENIYTDVTYPPRRMYLQMLTAADDVIGNVSQALKDKGLWDNTLIYWGSDNGGMTAYGSTSYPLRGNKNTLFEGAIRSPTVVSGGLLSPSVHGTIHNGLFHIVDWFTTFIEMAGGSTVGLVVDGVNQYNMLTAGQPSSRNEILLNIDIFPDSFKPTAGYAAFRYGDYKLIWGYPGYGQEWERPWEMCQDENAALSACVYANSTKVEPIDYVAMIMDMNADYGEWIQDGYENKFALYNILDDPSETHDIAANNTALVAEIKAKIQTFMLESPYPVFPQQKPEALPHNFGGVWSPGWCSISDIQELIHDAHAGVGTAPGAFL